MNSLNRIRSSWRHCLTCWLTHKTFSTIRRKNQEKCSQNPSSASCVPKSWHSFAHKCCTRIFKGLSHRLGGCHVDEYEKQIKANPLSKIKKAIETSAQDWSTYLNFRSAEYMLTEWDFNLLHHKERQTWWANRHILNVNGTVHRLYI